MPADDARTALAGTRFADVRWVDETGSTNADLLALAAEGARDGVVLVADHQTSGRGRLGRSWEAPPGSSLLCSTLLRPDLPVGALHLVTMAVGVAASDACEAVAGVRPRLKWPNDLLIGADRLERKVAGILAESTVRGGEVVALVVGMGINVNWPTELPPELASIATALNHHATTDGIDREQLLVAHLSGLALLLDDLATSDGRGALLQRYRQLSATLGRTVRVDRSAGAIVGIASDVDDEGHLLVDLGTETVPVAAGDVVHLRPID